IRQLKDDQCPVCHFQKYDVLNDKQNHTIEPLCGDTVRFRLPAHSFDYASDFPGHMIKSTPFAKLIQHKDLAFTLFKDGRMNVHGITEETDVH
ncbi:thiamine/molybdopterin biosynthesis protein, partial [Staphylococcus hominis]